MDWNNGFHIIYPYMNIVDIYYEDKTIPKYVTSQIGLKRECLTQEAFIPAINI